MNTEMKVAISIKPCKNKVIFVQNSIEIDIVMGINNDFTIIEYFNLESGDPQIRTFEVSEKWLTNYTQQTLQILKNSKTAQFALNHEVYLNRYAISLLEILLDNNAVITR